MSDEALALVVGTTLAVGALAFVLQPLFCPAAEDPAAPAPNDHADGDSAIVALREIEFDRATGKLSDADYAELRRIYAERALQEMHDSATQGPAGAGSAGDVDPIEARVRAVRATHRECPACGVRPEPDALYCSSCGRSLGGGAVTRAAGA